jgi:hypothetical protein
MIENKIDELKDKLYILLLNNAEYSEILKISQELDLFIVQYMHQNYVLNVDYKTVQTAPLHNL